MVHLPSVFPHVIDVSFLRAGTLPSLLYFKHLEQSLECVDAL